MSPNKISKDLAERLSLTAVWPYLRLIEITRIVNTGKVFKSFVTKVIVQVHIVRVVMAGIQRYTSYTLC